jgi:ubiquinone/menaquinone biosynthesis C-methylase UbiE
VGNEHVLDFGSGSGVCSKHLATRLQKGGGHLTCLDVSRTWNAVIQKTLKRYANVDYLLGDIMTLNIPDKSFDVIVSHFVIHDIPANERQAIVNQWARISKAGGKVFLREPIGSDGISIDELRRLMQQSGFKEAISRISQVPLMGKTLEGMFRIDTCLP